MELSNRLDQSNVIGCLDTEFKFQYFQQFPPQKHYSNSALLSDIYARTAVTVPTQLSHNQINKYEVQ